MMERPRSQGVATTKHRGSKLQQTFDPHTLDWSRHRLQPHEAETGPGLFLPDVASMIGARLLETWSGSETSDIVLPPAPSLEVPPPAHAFDDDDEPIGAVHQAYGGAVRDALVWEADERRRSWKPNGPLGFDHGSSRLQPGDELSIEDWERAYEAVVFPRELRNGARLSLERLAKAIAEMASFSEHDERSMTLIGRPVLGGSPRIIDRSLWSTGPELRMRRLAACGLNLDAPFDPEAPVTHLLFVAEEGLRGAIDAYASENLFLAADDFREWWPGRPPTRRSWTLALDQRIREVLVPELLKKDNLYWRVAQAQRFIRLHASFKHDFDYDAIVARVCSDLKKEADEQGISYAHLGRPGRSRKGLTLVRKR